MKKVSNKIMLITYADCMGHDLKDLNTVLDKYLDGAVYGLHILPFFPSSADRGFAPTTYDIVDPQFGDWDDMKKLSEKYYLMYDYMINHISAHSEIFHVIPITKLRINDIISCRCKPSVRRRRKKRKDVQSINSTIQIFIQNRV